MIGSGSVVALDVGGSSIKCAVVDADGSTRFESSRPVRRDDPAATVAAVGALAVELVDRASDEPGGGRAEAVGLVVPGVVDTDRGVAVSSMLLGWRDIPFVRQLQELTGLPVGFGHDVVGGALAEAELGAARGVSDWLFLALGTGLGSCFALRGAPYRGAHGVGGELAHVVAVPDGLPCRCGKRGCAEMYFSGAALVDRMVEAGRPVTTAEEAVDAARAGDATAVRIWDEAVTALATVVAHQVEMLDPALIVVGGGLADSGLFLLEPFQRQLYDRVAFVPRPPIRPAQLGARAGLMGAAVLARAML